MIEVFNARAQSMTGETYYNLKITEDMRHIELVEVAKDGRRLEPKLYICTNLPPIEIIREAK